MNKKDLINEIYPFVGVKATSKAIVDTIFDTMKETLIKRKEDVRIVGFGTFTVVKRKARKVRNPKTGETIKTKARKVVKFRPSPDLRNI